MAGIVAETSHETGTYVLREMPLKMVFAYEHLFYIKNGYGCEVLSFKQSLDDLLKSL